MGSGAKRCACFKGYGPVPVGQVSWNVVERGSPNPFQPPPSRVAEAPRVPSQRPGLSLTFDRCAAPSEVQLSRRVVSAGCDIGVSDRDPHTGFVVLAHLPGRPLEVLDAPVNYSAREAVLKVPRAINAHGADYLVIDAPLLPVPTDRPPDDHVGFFRPHEKLVSQPTNAAVAVMPEHDQAYVGAFGNRLQVFSTWGEETRKRAPFAIAGQSVLDEVSRHTCLRYQNDFRQVPDAGIFEGFPKLFYALAPAVDLAKITDLRAKGEVDEAVLAWLLDLGHPERLWAKVGIELPAQGSASNRRLSLALEDPDQICALAMAVNGLLLARGRASVLCSSNRNGSFDFGHILALELGLIEPWAQVWLADRMSKASADFPAVRTWGVDGV